MAKVEERMQSGARPGSAQARPGSAAGPTLAVTYQEWRVKITKAETKTVARGLL